jgi:hypothetical protein
VKGRRWTFFSGLRQWGHQLQPSSLPLEPIVHDSEPSPSIRPACRKLTAGLVSQTHLQINSAAATDFPAHIRLPLDELLLSGARFRFV